MLFIHMDTNPNSGLMFWESSNFKTLKTRGWKHFYRLIGAMEEIFKLRLLSLPVHLSSQRHSLLLVKIPSFYSSPFIPSITH